MPAKQTVGERVAAELSVAYFVDLKHQAKLAAAIDRAVQECEQDMVTLAKGCVDYGGGYRSDDEKLAIYHHGIQTVVNVLESFCKRGFEDTQVAAVYSFGARSQGETK